jgi:Winged helix DNA-binding domain
MPTPTKPTPQVNLTWDQALSWRVEKQLLRVPLTDPVRVVAALGGVQTQVASSAVQVISIRCSKRPDIDGLLWKRRALIKTWAMRGTLHLLPSIDYWTWVAMMRGRPRKITPGWEKYHGVSATQLTAITEAIGEVMTEEAITREEMTSAVVRATGDPTLGAALKSGWSQLLKPAARRGLLIQGPPRGRNVTFVSPTAWLGETEDPSLDYEVPDLVERFFDVNGPATSEDFARWLGLAHKTARELMDGAVERLVLVEVEGWQGWMTVAGAGGAASLGPSAGDYLLPGFDPYTLAPISHRAHTIPPGRLNEVSRTAGWIAPVIVHNGRIVGTWEQGAGSSVAIRPFGKLSKTTLGSLAKHAVDRYQGLLGDDPRIVVREP